jgi:hypothetical protein
MSTRLAPADLFSNHSILGIEVVNDRLWRVVARRGPVLGHIECIKTEDGERFHARRLLAGSHRILELGFFWRVDDAVDCFR